jgi:hypothetical protein
MQISDSTDLDIGESKIFEKTLEKNPFILIIGKYDHTLGPRSLFTSIPLNGDNFIRNLLRDALNTKNKFVILDFTKFYAQIYKIEIPDALARGGKQLYAIIMLRDADYPIIPILHFKRIEMLFHKIDNKRILSDDTNAFKRFFSEINEIYQKKGEIVPLESINLQIRSGVNTIQGFCEILLEKLKIDEYSKEETISHIELMLDSCNEIIDALENHGS